MLYNSGRFEESIAAATSAKRKPAAVSSATLIIARARLERFRTMSQPEDLATARAELVSLDPHSLSPQEAIEWLVGVARRCSRESTWARGRNLHGSPVRARGSELS
jgi:hypothetical protein